MVSDFGCYVTIKNGTAKTMTLTSKVIIDGTWVTEPAASIPSGGYSSFHLRDNAGFAGSEGFVTYEIATAAGPVYINVHFSCPVWATHNIFTVSSSNPKFFSPVAEGNETDHPLKGTVTVSPTPLDNLPNTVKALTKVGTLMGKAEAESGNNVKVVTDLDDETVKALGEVLTHLKVDGFVTRNLVVSAN